VPNKGAGFFDCGIEVNGFVFNNCTVSHRHLRTGKARNDPVWQEYWRTIKVKEWNQGEVDQTVNFIQCTGCSAIIPRDFFIAYLRLHGSRECQPYIAGRI
jgi:hypothetical protein